MVLDTASCNRHHDLRYVIRTILYQTQEERLQTRSDGSHNRNGRNQHYKCVQTAWDTPMPGFPAAIPTTLYLRGVFQLPHHYVGLQLH